MSWSKPENPICIYVLKCPYTEQVKYVGQTITGLTRIHSHWKDFRVNQAGKLTLVKSWIKSLKKENKKFLVEYIDYATSREELNQKEIYWIKYYVNSGINLLNHTEGGNSYGSCRYTEEQKQIISIRTKEAMQNPEIRQKFLTGLKRRQVPKNYKPRSDETKKIHANSEYVKSKRIKIQDNNGIFYESLKDCAIKLGVTKQNIWRAIHKGGVVKGLTLKRVE